MVEVTTVLLTYYLMLGPEPGKREAALATYKYSGLERSLETYSEGYPKSIRVLVANSVLIVSGVTSRSITYSWEF